MECNKDEAGRAMEIAQRKLSAKDLEAAKKFALKAQQLYPCLEGLSQIMAILEVHLAAERRVNGLMDWYGILQLDDLMADDSVLKKQYRKLALLLHPDKNKSVGAEGAFKLIVEAWGVLSDKGRRADYDQKRNQSEFKQALTKKRPQSHSQNQHENRPQNRPPKTHHRKSPQKQPQKPPQSAPQMKKPPVNGYRDSAPAATAPTSTSIPTPNPPQAKSTTFWTVCPYCGMQYEYLRIYENYNLLCRNCQKPFLAVEAAAIPIPISSLTASCYPCPFASMGYSNQGGGFGAGMGGFANGPRVETYPNINFVWGPFPAPNVATTSATETVNRTLENASEGARRDEGKGDSSANDDWEVPIRKKIGEEAMEKLLSGLKSSSSPKILERPKKRKFDNCDKVDDREAAVNEDANKSPCRRMDLNNAEVETVQIECSKEQPRQVVWESSNANLPSASKASKPAGNEASPAGKPILPTAKSTPPIGKPTPQTGKQTPPPMSKDCSSKSVRELLVEKAKMEIIKQLAEAKKNAEKTAAAKAEALAAAAAAAAAAEEEEASKRALDASKAQSKVKKPMKNEKREAENKVKKPTKDKKKKSKKQSDGKYENVIETTVDSLSITVPDSDFYDFDKDRTESCFEANQIWSMYDDNDGMPRFYARIQKVVSLDPFKVQMNWIEPKINKYQTCGDFKVGKLSSNELINIFSHVMRWEKSSKGTIKILPRKLDIWAFYKDWDSSWNESTLVEVKRKFEIVEVVTDYTDELGVSVVPLVKVGGFKNVFQKKQDVSDVVVVPKKELLRFSHQVPSRKLTKEEVPNVPEDCWELDPAATPIELLHQVSTQDEEKAAG